jgi:hypothetical protein
MEDRIKIFTDQFDLLTMNRPNFFIVGTPKAGTTSLYYYLEEHPDIFMSPIKETNYFSFDEIKSQGLFYNEEHISSQSQYLEQFKEVKNEKAIGEASVSYLYYPAVTSKIKEFNPESKIIIVLRNPVERGFSHYLMDRRLGFVTLSYEEIVSLKTQHPKSELYFQQYVALGQYYEQVKRYLTLFGEKQVKILYYEDIVKDIEKVIKELYTFLEVDSTYTPDSNQEYNVYSSPKNFLMQKLYAQKKVRRIAKKIFGSNVQTQIKDYFFSKDKPVLNKNLKAELIEIYKENIYKTSELLKKDLSPWLYQ